MVDTTFVKNVTRITADWLNHVNDTIYGVVNVKQFGAVGDGITDDTSAIQSALDYAATLVNTSGDTLNTTNKPVVYFPSCDGYLTSAVINCPKGAGMIMDAPIIRSGILSTASPALIIGSDITGANEGERSQEYVLDIRRQTQGDWVDQSDIGIKINAINVCKVWIKNISGFAIGCRFTGAFNETTIGDLRNNGIGLLLTDTANDFTNQNNFYGGEIACSNNTNMSSSRYGVKLLYAGNSIINSNRFYGTSFESQTPTSGEQIPIIIDGAWNTLFTNIRYENTTDDVIMKCSNDARWNTISEINLKEFDVSREDAVDDGSTYKIGNTIKHDSDPDAEDGFLIFDSGFLRDQLIDYDGTYWSLRGMECLADNGANPNPPGFLSGGSIDGVNDDGSVDLSASAPGAWGVRIKTNRCKQFIVAFDGPSGFNGTLNIVAFDSTGLQLVANTDVFSYGSTPTVNTNTGVYGVW